MRSNGRVVGAAWLVVSGCTFFDPSLGPGIDSDAAGALRDVGASGDAGPGVDARADATADGAAESGPRPVSFRNDIRPLMDRSNQDPAGHGCKACHYSTQPEHNGLDISGLDLATLGALRRGGSNTGASIVVAGDPAASFLPQKLRGTFPRGARMPRDGPPYWSEAEIALVERWITEGAVGADSE